MTRSIAIVGLGDHALQSHVKHLKDMPDVTLVGAFDPAENGFKAAKQVSGIDLHRYKTYEDILEDETISAVLIATPDRFHLPQLQAAVRAGKHVFCEKPMCNDLEEAEQLKASLALAREQGLVVTSCHPRRFDPPYLWLKENMTALQERFGAPLELQLDFTYHKPSKDLHGGSMLQDHFNHEVDYLHCLFGHDDLEAIKWTDQADYYNASGIRADGIVFNFKGTRRLETQTYAETIDLRFNRGSVHIDTYCADNSYLSDHHQPKTAHEKIKDIGVTDYDVRFRGINQNWIDAMDGIVENYLTDKDMITNSYLSVIFKKQRSVEYKF